MDGLFPGFLGGLGIVAIGLTVAAMRSAAPLLLRLPGRVESFGLEKDSAQVFEQVLAFAPAFGYKVAALDEKGRRVVLSDSASATSWGFFYAIHVKRMSDGNTLVEMGSRSRFIQWGPIASRKRETCVSSLKAWLLSH